MLRWLKRPSRTQADSTLSQDQDSRIEVASQWTLMWWKFRKDRLAVVGGIVVILTYLIALNAEFFAPKPSVWYDKVYV